MDAKLIWAAGFIDGEGYVGATNCTHGVSAKRNSYTAVINVGQVSRVPLDILQEILGGSVGPLRDRFGFHYQWRVYGDKAAAAAARLLPYLVVKRRQAELLLEFQATKTKSRCLTDEVYARRVAIHAELRELNGRRQHVQADRLSKETPQPEGDAIVGSQENKNPESQQETAGRLRIA